ncbi:MAG: rRNA maturation RNase YbeY [Armatimonadetes bacterium]|nr:rRNA maturation RNase YbeY [Armatimonadota bacterium]
MRVHIAAAGVRHSIPLGLLRGAALTAMRATRCPRRAEIEIALVDDATIGRLNRRFLGHRGPTDVLAFPGEPASPAARTHSAEPGLRGPLLGEIVISVERARAQARDAGWSVRREVVLLLVHGLLHLRGYDDHAVRDAGVMRALERKILERIFGSGG